MWPDLIMLPPPVCEQHLRLQQRREYLPIKQFIGYSSDILDDLRTIVNGRGFMMFLQSYIVR